MLNIYRVISLSLVMSMFITAPLLCVHPISSQLKKEQKLAAKNKQLEKVMTVLKNRNKKPSLEAKTAVRKRSIHRSSNNRAGHEYELPFTKVQSNTTSAVFVETQANNWHDDKRQE